MGLFDSLLDIAMSPVKVTAQVAKKKRLKSLTW